MSKKTIINRSAFTLAETLITLGIIGIAAVITLPLLINSIQDKQFKSKYKKTVSNFSQALKMVYAKEGENIELVRDFDDTNFNDMDYHICNIANEMQVLVQSKGIEKCSINNATKQEISWHEKDKWFNKKKENQALNIGYTRKTIILNDGIMVNFNCNNNIYIDVNGYKKPNTIGRDIFFFRINRNNTSEITLFGDTNGCTGTPYNTNLNEKNFKEDCINGTGWGCSALYILE